MASACNNKKEFYGNENILSPTKNKFKIVGGIFSNASKEIILCGQNDNYLVKHLLKLPNSENCNPLLSKEKLNNVQKFINIEEHEINSGNDDILKNKISINYSDQIGYSNSLISNQNKTFVDTQMNYLKETLIHSNYSVGVRNNSSEATHKKTKAGIVFVNGDDSEKYEGPSIVCKNTNEVKIGCLCNSHNHSQKVNRGDPFGGGKDDLYANQISSSSSGKLSSSFQSVRSVELSSSSLIGGLEHASLFGAASNSNDLEKLDVSVEVEKCYSEQTSSNMAECSETPTLNEKENIKQKNDVNNESNEKDDSVEIDRFNDIKKDDENNDSVEVDQSNDIKENDEPKSESNKHDGSNDIKENDESKSESDESDRSNDIKENDESKSESDENDDSLEIGTFNYAMLSKLRLIDTTIQSSHNDELEEDFAPPADYFNRRRVSFDDVTESIPSTKPFNLTLSTQNSESEDDDDGTESASTSHQVNVDILPKISEENDISSHDLMVTKTEDSKTDLDLNEEVILESEEVTNEQDLEQPSGNVEENDDVTFTPQPPIRRRSRSFSEKPFSFQCDVEAEKSEAPPVKPRRHSFIYQQHLAVNSDGRLSLSNSFVENNQECFTSNSQRASVRLVTSLSFDQGSTENVQNTSFSPKKNNSLSRSLKNLFTGGNKEGDNPPCLPNLLKRKKNKKRKKDVTITEPNKNTINENNLSFSNSKESFESIFKNNAPPNDYENQSEQIFPRRKISDHREPVTIGSAFRVGDVDSESVLLVDATKNHNQEDVNTKHYPHSPYPKQKGVINVTDVANKNLVNKSAKECFQYIQFAISELTAIDQSVSNLKVTNFPNMLSENYSKAISACIYELDLALDILAHTQFYNNKDLNDTQNHIDKAVEELFVTQPENIDPVLMNNVIDCLTRVDTIMSKLRTIMECMSPNMKSSSSVLKYVNTAVFFDDLVEDYNRSIKNALLEIIRPVIKNRHPSEKSVRVYLSHIQKALVISAKIGLIEHCLAISNYQNYVLSSSEAKLTDMENLRLSNARVLPTFRTVSDYKSASSLALEEIEKSNKDMQWSQTIPTTTYVDNLETVCSFLDEPHLPAEGLIGRYLSSINKTALELQFFRSGRTDFLDISARLNLIKHSSPDSLYSKGTSLRDHEKRGDGFDLTNDCLITRIKTDFDAEEVLKDSPELLSFKETFDEGEGKIIPEKREGKIIPEFSFECPEDNEEFVPEIVITTLDKSRSNSFRNIQDVPNEEDFPEYFACIHNCQEDQEVTEELKNNRMSYIEEIKSEDDFFASSDDDDKESDFEIDTDISTPDEAKTTITNGIQTLEVKLRTWRERQNKENKVVFDDSVEDTPSPGPPADISSPDPPSDPPVGRSREEERIQKDRCVEVYPETLRQRQRNMAPSPNKVDIKTWSSSSDPHSPAKARKFLPSVKALRSQFEPGRHGSVTSSSASLDKAGSCTSLDSSENLDDDDAVTTTALPEYEADFSGDDFVEPIYSQFKKVDDELRRLMTKPPSTSGWNPRSLLKRLYYLPDAPKAQSQGTTYINIQGYLEKLPSGRKKATFWNAWKRRYFVAKDGVLYYYQNNQTDKPSMKLTLMGGKVETMDSNMVGVDDGGKCSIMLGIDDSKGHFVVVRCSSRAEADRWRLALETHTADDFSSQFVAPWPIPKAPAMLRDAIVIDVGASSVRAGVLASMPTLPQIFYPTVVATERETRRQIWGFEALSPEVRSSSTLSFPVRPSHKISKYSVDLGAVSSLLQKTFADLRVDPKNYHLQLSVPRVLNNNTQTELLRILFEKYGVKSVNLTHQSILALYAYNATSGIVVDIGERMDIVPVIDGYIVDGGVSRVPYGGYRILDHLRQFLYMKNISLINHVDSFIIRQVLENICYCAHHYNTEKARCTNNCESYEKSVSLTENHGDNCPYEKISLDFGRFQATEGLFNPDAWGLDHPGLHKLVHKAIQECSMDIRKEMSRSIFLAGGVTQLPGLVERLTTEIDNLTPAAIRPKVHASPHRYHAAYLGACVLAESPAFVQSRISREEWLKQGSSALRKWSL